MITPEATRRLMHYYLDHYAGDKRIKKIVDSTELWFVVSANPDGYDYFKDPSNRLWRKEPAGSTPTVSSPRRRRRPQPQLRLQVGLRRRGFVTQSHQRDLRGATPGSEPETSALDRFEKRIGFTYGINYHSAAELLLYGVGWQVATPTPDDVLYKSLAGTPDNPAIPGYRSQVSSELYTTNGEADGHAANVNGMAMFTPEMSTCQSASNSDPNDAWNAADCQSVFNFPDDEKLIQKEFEKNPFALSVAETAAHPTSRRPRSASTLPTSPRRPSRRRTRAARTRRSRSWRGSPCVTRSSSTASTAATKDVSLKSWKGGRTYGGEDNLYFDEYRPQVRDGDPGDKGRGVVHR